MFVNDSGTMTFMNRLIVNVVMKELELVTIMYPTMGFHQLMVSPNNSRNKPASLRLKHRSMLAERVPRCYSSSER